jgi:hypothetical protein
MVSSHVLFACLQMQLFYGKIVNVHHAEGKLKRNLGWKLRLLVMCGIRTWFDF